MLLGFVLFEMRAISHIGIWAVYQCLNSHDNFVVVHARHHVISIWGEI